MIDRYLKRLIIISILILPSLKSFAQPISVVDGATNPYTPENLITNVFMGQGVTVTDVQFFGNPIAVGYFDEALPTIGMERGLIMSTGRVASTNMGLGVDNPGSNFASSNTESNFSDADLQSLTNGQGIQNLCKYVISFIPTSDTIEFNFVWASEEYPEWACTPFNDVFGFFINGPGINGPYENNAENIALIPGTTTPISIENIHPQKPGDVNCPPVNEEFFIDNNGSANHPVYDGFTQVFTARAVVTPCEEYNKVSNS